MLLAMIIITAAEASEGRHKASHSLCRRRRRSNDGFLHESASNSLVKYRLIFFPQKKPRRRK